MFSRKNFSKAMLIGAFLFTSFFVNASLTPVGDLVQVSVNITEYKNNGDIKNINDCAGYFGSGFTNCEITHVPTSGSDIFATVMAKYDAENSANNEFILGSTSSTDWSFSNSINGATEGNWTYSGSSYPGISFWVSKGGSEGFILNWMVSQDSIDNNDCQAGNEFTISCLNVSVAVTSGYWAAPEPHNISHITFYGNKCDNNCGTTPQQVPEPTSIALFALALLGIAGRRQSSISK